MFRISGRDGTDSRAATVSDILIQAAAVVVSSLLAHGRTSVVDTVDIGGMLRIQKVFIGMKQRTAIPATGLNSCHAMKNLNSESTDTWISLTLLSE